MEQYASIQQLKKKEPGAEERKNIFPPTPVQAVFDAKTGASLEALLAQMNNIHVPYQGTPYDTRNIIPLQMRRAGLTITYMDMEGSTITERASNAVQKDNGHWGLDTNWSRIDELSLSGDIAVSASGTWIINGEDTGITARGSKGDTGLTPWLKTIDNKLHYSYDNETWEVCSESIAAWFRWSGNKIQISRDNKTWTDLSGVFADNVHIKGYVSSYASLPTNAAQGDIYGVGPTYADTDTEQTNPIYRYYVKNESTWVDNGVFTSIAAGIVQETGDSESAVMSQKAVTEELTELETELGGLSSITGDMRKRIADINAVNGTSDEEEEILVQDDEGNTIVEFTNDGADFKKKLTRQGVEVVTKDEVSALKYIESVNDTSDEEEEISIVSNSGKKIISITEDRVHCDKLTSSDIDIENTIDTEEEVTCKDDEGNSILKITRNGVALKSPTDIDGTALKKRYGYFDKVKVSPIAPQIPLIYKADTKVSEGYIVNSLVLDDGEIIACRSNGKVVKIGFDGTEMELLYIPIVGEWRLCWQDSKGNVYVSPHGSFGGSVAVSDRGLYRLSKGANQFEKVLSLYDTSSSDVVLTQDNDDTIWTMCEDSDGYLYAGVYCHSVRYAPRMYRSKDGGATWDYYHDFLSESPGAKHVHCIIYNQYNNALYCILGEVNTIWKSIDKGETWVDLNTPCENAKGTTLTAVKDGIIIGSDSGYECIMSKLYSDDATLESKSAIWADIVFAVRQSDITGWLYAFCRVDSSVNVTSYMPPIEALKDSSVLDEWKNTNPSHLKDWEKYNERVKDFYPNDAIRPTHFAIQRSMDGGESWEVIYREEISGTYPDGVISAGYFKNGECLFSRYINGMPSNPMVIAEGNFTFNAEGIDLDNKIYSRI